MEQRVLGKSKISIPVVGFGCGPNARLMVGDDVLAQRLAVRHAIELGAGYFDTAAGYGSGRSEENLGRALVGVSPRPMVSTKVVLEAEHQGNPHDAVLRSVEKSLDRLGLEKVDALILHNRVARDRDYPKPPGSGVLLHLGEIFGTNGVAPAFERLLGDGRARSVGFTAFGGQPVAIEEMMSSGLFAVLNVSYNILNPSAGVRVPSDFGAADYECVIDKAAAAGVGVMAIRVLDSGTLARPSEDPLLARLGALAAGAGENLVGLAIRYVLTNPAVQSAIMGFSTFGQIDEACDAASRGPLEPELVAALHRVVLEVATS